MRRSTGGDLIFNVILTDSYALTNSRNPLCEHPRRVSYLAVRDTALRNGEDASASKCGSTQAALKGYISGFRLAVRL